MDKLFDAIRNGRLSHAYIIEGDALSGKYETAKRAAKAVLCEEAPGEGCGRCVICQKVEHENHEDVYHVSADESSLMQMMVNEGYNLFLERCAQGRGMTKEEVDKVGQGRVWTGADALELGLVDELGGLDRALEIAVEKAGVEHYTLMSYPAPRPFLESLKRISPTRFMGARLLPEEASGLYRMAKQLHEMEPRERLQARLPFELNVR